MASFIIDRDFNQGIRPLYVAYFRNTPEERFKDRLGKKIGQYNSINAAVDACVHYLLGGPNLWLGGKGGVQDTMRNRLISEIFRANPRLEKMVQDERMGLSVSNIIHMLKRLIDKDLDQLARVWD